MKISSIFVVFLENTNFIKFAKLTKKFQKTWPQSWNPILELLSELTLDLTSDSNGDTFATVYNSKCVSVFLNQTIFCSQDPTTNSETTNPLYEFFKPYLLFSRQNQTDGKKHS